MADLEAFIPIKAEQAANIPSSIVPVVAELGAEDRNTGIDEKLVTEIKLTFSTQAIAGARILKESGLDSSKRKIVEEIMRIPTHQRLKFLQSFQSIAGEVREGEIRAWPEVGNSDELRLAQKYGSAGGMKQLTRYDFIAQLLALGPGKTGAMVRMNLPEEVDGETMITLEYGLEDKEPYAKMAFPLKTYTFVDFRNYEQFFKELRDDGHEVKRCFGDPYHDFFIAFFMCSYSGSWNGNLRRMKFTERPGSRTMRLPFMGKSRDLMRHDGPVFGSVMQEMLRHLSALDVPEAPKNQFAWLHENSSVALKNSGKFKALVHELVKNWEDLSDEIAALEGSFISQLTHIRSGPAHFVPIAFHNALDKLVTARAYRGSKDGEGVSSFLNMEAKQVGLDPLGFIAPIYDEVKRHLPVLEEIRERGGGSVSIYTDSRTAEVSGLAKKLGLDIRVFTSAGNTAYTTHSFPEDGFHENDDAKWRIIDQFPKVKGESGHNPDMLEWNAHRDIHEKVAASKAERVVLFTRLFTEKKNKDQYMVDAPNIVRSWRPALEVAFSFKGLHPHNGEYVLWLSRVKQEVKNKTVFFDVSDRAKAEGIVSALTLVVSSRIALANDLRTWALPSGVSGFYPRPMAIKSSQYEEIINPMKEAFRVMRLRMLPEVRAVLAESRTKSTASEFGTEAAKVLLEEASAALGDYIGEGSGSKVLPVVPVKSKVQEAQTDKEDPLNALIGV